MLSRISRSFVSTFKSTRPANILPARNFGLPTIRYSFTSTSDPTQVALLEETEAKVFQVLKSAAKCNQAKLSRNASFEELGFDSLDSVELVVAME
jgi:hypothetical protein